MTYENGATLSISFRRQCGRFRAVAITIMALLMLQGIVIFAPISDEPSSVDAIVVLAPLNYRLDDGMDLANEGWSDTMAVSTPGTLSLDADCDELLEAFGEMRVEVVCFAPVPATTRGESAAFEELAKQHGWNSAAVVTDRSHLNRARMYFEMCAPGIDYQFILADRDRTAQGRVYDYFYESGAWIKAIVTGVCRE